jgi:L-threonylcarbamoyladenylate synthase
MASPGVGLRHYAPKARLVLVEGLLEELEARLTEALKGLPGERVGLMLPAEIPWPMHEAIPHLWGRWAVPAELASELYAGLRALDSQGCTVIVCPMPPSEGIGAAIRDRLLKAGNRDKGLGTGE